MVGGLLRLDAVCLGTGDGAARSGRTLLLTPDGATAVVRVTAEGSLATGCGGAAVRVTKAENRTLAATMVVPLPYVWMAGGVAVMLVLMLPTLLVMLARVRTLHPALEARALADYPGTGTYAVLQRAAVAPHRRSAALVHRAETLLSWLAVPALSGVLLVVAGALSDATPWALAEQERPGLEHLVRRATDAGLYLGVGVALGLLALGAGMRRSQALTRGVGVLWDLTTFWPRSAHPFGPPCYGERVVPELVGRLGAVLDAGGRVVLSGHSQGSTIGVAVLEQLRSRPGFDRVHVVTYGSQLRVWFGRVFPAVLGPQVLGSIPTVRPTLAGPVPDLPPASPTAVPPPAPGTLMAALGVGLPGARWVNLFRRSDPLGFHVRADEEGPGVNDLDVYVAEVGGSDPHCPAPGNAAQGFPRRSSRRTAATPRRRSTPTSPAPGCSPPQPGGLREQESGHDPSSGLDDERDHVRVQATLRPEPASVGEGRQITARLCAQAGLPEDLVETAVLLTSETVTNAIVHGRSEARLDVLADADHVRVEVGDDNSRHPILEVDDTDALDGRGVRLLQHLATTWGVRDEPFGKAVWFELRTG